MTNYKEMYLIMARAAEKAIRILIEAQQTCEELAIAEDDTAAPTEEGNRIRLLVKGKP